MITDIERANHFITQISSRRERLLAVGENLKERFVGLDEVIDKIIKYIEVWYVMPELLTRPCIVCLWGMTGVGKTDLVRKLVKELNQSENYLEIQMTNEGSSSHPYASTLNNILTYSNLEAGRQGILLLDEMQRFRSINEEGKEIHDYKLQDIWMLLSDGRFANSDNNKERMYEMLFEMLYDMDYEEAKKSQEHEDDTEDSSEIKSREKQMQERAAEVERKRKFKASYFKSRQLKKICKLEDTIDEIMKWDTDKRIMVIQDHLQKQSTYEGDDFSKMLIFVSGNIDEAYEMASQCDESDMDADLFHKHSKHISMLTIKKALTRRFKPEQIASSQMVEVVIDDDGKMSIVDRTNDPKVKKDETPSTK